MYHSPLHGQLESLSIKVFLIEVMRNEDDFCGLRVMLNLFK
jgi:hypothetical protein